MRSVAPSVRARPAPGEASWRRPAALLGISLGYFMVLLDTTIVSVAEPDLARSLRTSVAGLQWAVTGYTVVFGALLLSAGAVADRYGAHRSFRIGVAVFGAGSALSALAPSLWTLVLLRGLLGVAAAACVPASMAMITGLYADPARRARAVATWAAVSGAALAAGPVAGGLLVEAAGWRAVYWVNVPLAVITLALTAGRIVRCARTDRAIDWRPQLAACLALGLLTDALIAAGAGSWAHAGCSAAGFVLAGAAYIVAERRSAAPVLSPDVLRAPGMPAALIAGGAVNLTMTGVLFVLPLLFQQVMRLSPLETGFAFLPMTIPFAINPLVTGRIVARVGPRPPVLAGLVLLAVGTLGLGGAAYAGSPYPVLVGGLVCVGLGVSFALPALATTVVTAAPQGRAGAAGGLLNAVRQFGATLGVAVMGALVAVGGPADAVTGGRPMSGALVIAAVACGAAAVGVARKR